MKKIQKTNLPTKIALFAGATALMTLAPNAHAQSSVDALLNKLEQKGILTVDEAKDLKAENAEDSATDFNKALNSKFIMPDWITSYKLYGDLRGRFDDETTDLHAFSGDDNNMRLRYRLRVGLLINMKDNMQVGFRLGSDDTGKGADASTGNPLSNNSTLQGNGSKKPVWVDAAYAKWMPINDNTMTLTTIAGKMDNPFLETPMVFDPDYTPEGAALQATYKFDSNNTLAFNSGAFVIDQVNTRGPFYYGAQVIWSDNWTSKITTSAGVAAYDIANQQNFAATATPYDSNLGNTFAGGRFVYHYNPIVADGGITYTLDSFPLYPGAFPVRFAGEYMNNPAASSNNKGWNAGIYLGKLVKQGTWDVSYRYQRLEADAWWDQLVDDDNVALFPTSATAGSAAGGTDIKGHLIKFDYLIFDSLTFSFTCYINDVVNNNIAGATTVHAPSGAVHAMADLMWKF